MPHQNRSGFTIVELLIVIVVIAILATISVVAYNGIQERARRTAHVAAASQAEKDIMAYALQKNGESISLSNTLVGYKEGEGRLDLLEPLTGVPDITMYAVYEAVGASHGYNPFMYLEPNIWGSHTFMLDTFEGGSGAIGYRIDTSTQSNVTRHTSSGYWVPGKTSICWVEVSNNATVRDFNCDDGTTLHTDTLTAHSGWNFTSVSIDGNIDDKVYAGLVFHAAHDQATRQQVVEWLADKYAVSL